MILIQFSLLLVISKQQASMKSFPIILLVCGNSKPPLLFSVVLNLSGNPHQWLLTPFLTGGVSGHPQSIFRLQRSTFSKRKKRKKSCPCQRILTTPKGDRSQNSSRSGGPLAPQSYMMRESGHRSQRCGHAAWASPPLHIV